DRAQLGDDPGQHHDGEIGVVVLDPHVPEGLDLVPGGGQAHHARAVQGAIAVDVALGQGEGELRLEVHFCAGARVSYSTVISMSTASFEPADSAPTLIFDGQAPVKFQRPISLPSES